MRFLLSIVFTGAIASAQPTDAQIKKDLMNPGVLSITFTKPTGTKSWNTSTKVFEYARGVHITRSTEMPGVKLLVIGDAVYQSYSGVYKYWKFRVIENRYDGIPNPTEAEVISVLSKEWPKFYGHQQTMIVELTKQPRFAAEPAWTWHDPKSVSVLLTASYEMIRSGQRVQEAVEQDFEVRLYRDDMKGQWLRFISQAKGDPRVLSSKQLTPTQAANKPRLNLQLANAAATQKMAALPAMSLPAFGSAKEVVDYAYKILRDGDEKQLEAFLRQTLAPSFFAGNGPALTPFGEQLVSNVTLQVYGDDVKFKDQYPPALRLGSLTSRKHFYVGSCFANVNSTIAVDNFNGVWKIFEFEPRVNQSAGKCR